MIHRAWIGAPGAYDFHDTLAALNPGVEIRDWTPATIPDQWADLAARSARFVLESDADRHWANVVRVCALNEHGGWWADHDLEPLVPFADLPFPATALHRSGNRCNCWLAFPADHPTLREALYRIDHAQPRPPHHLRERRASTIVSGEQLLNGTDVPGVLLWREWDGTINSDASAWAIHHHASVTR